MAHSDDQIFDAAGAQPAPTLSEETVVPAVVSREAAQAMVAEGAEVEMVSEDEAIARAEAHGVKLKPNPKGSPNYGHPWAIIKTGFGTSSAINLQAEIYVNDNWTIEPGVSLGLSYGAALIGTRWHPDALCFNCNGTVSFTLSPGVEAGRAFAGLDKGPGTIITASGEAEFRYRPAKHFILAAGVRASAGTYIDDPYTSWTYNGPTPSPGPGPSGNPPTTGPTGTPPNPQSNPDQFTRVDHGPKANFYGDASFYIGIGF